VAGSKRAWKQTRSFGRHYDQLGVPVTGPAAAVRATDVDQLVCNALADSLLTLSKDLLAAAAAAAEDSETTVGSNDDADVFGTMSALGLLHAPLPPLLHGDGRRRTGSSPAARPCASSVRSCCGFAAARRDAVPAAVVVVEQLGARGVLPGDGELLHCAVDVMHACGA
jgi:hypothetical protein